MRFLTIFAVCALAAACSREVTPVALDTANTACASCRMAASDVHFAAQIAAPGAEPVFFDDIGCLRDYLKAHQLPAGAVAFVADHRTGEWIRAADAMFSRPRGLSTPMGGGFVAHATSNSRLLDVAASDASPVTVQDIFGPAGPPNGGRE